MIFTVAEGFGSAMGLSLFDAALDMVNEMKTFGQGWCRCGGGWSRQGTAKGGCAVMKALFIRCNGKLTPDMLVGGLIDMGVPPAYLRTKLEAAGVSSDFIESSNLDAKVSAHYFCIPEKEDKPLLLKQKDLFVIWRKICEGGESGWESLGWKVFSALSAGASDALDEIPATIIDLRRCRVKEENLISLYCFLAGLDYLGVETLFTCPFSLAAGTSEAARTTEKILTRAVSTTENVISSEDIDPFAAAILEGLSAGFIAMDGRFLVDKTAYGTASVEK